MLQLSNITDTQIGVKFKVTNLDVTGYTAQLKINGKEYSLSPVMDGAVASATVPLADSLAINAVYFIAEVTIFDANSDVYQISEWQGMKVGYSVDGLFVDNVMDIILAPPFPVPDGSGGGGGGGVTPDQVPSLARYEQDEIPASDISSTIQLESESANVYDLTQETGSITVALPTDPSATDKKCADVVARFDTGATVPTLTFDPTTDRYLPVDGDANWGTLTASSMNIFSFTSIGTDGSGNRVWMVGRVTAAI